jgi:phosphatidate cytidylyltransferase
MRYELLLILLGVSVVLALASVTGLVLRVSAQGTAIIAIQNLNTRVKAWWWIVFVLASAFLSGRIALIALFAGISFIALREFLAVTSAQAADRRTVIACFVIILPAQYGLVAMGRYDWFAGCIPFVSFIILPVLTALTGDTRNYLARTSQLLFGVVICVYCISHIPALLILHIAGYEGRQDLLMLFLIVVTQASDVLQYLWGRLFGRHKVAPQLSPSKTVEGLIGGMASATALGFGLWWMTPFSVVQSGAIAFLIVLPGFLGGLVMSAIKRDRGLKDWSRFIPGHGGILDRMDSLCFSAPLFFHLIRIFFAG